MADIELYSNFDTFDTFKEFKKEFRKQIIETGLDKSLIDATTKLKDNLLFIVNNSIRMDSFKTAPNQAIPVKNKLEQPTVNIPKSESELIKFLTDGKVDPSRYNQAKDYTTLNETGLVFGNKGGSPFAANSANRVTLRMEIEAGETVETQHQKAVKFFNEALFALPDSSGNVNYYMNPGIDLSKVVKIKCSVLTGFGDTPTRKGLNPAERFKKTQERGYAEWTLKQDSIEVIRKHFIDITEVMNLLKNGDIDRAKQMVDQVDKNQTLSTVKNQIDKLETNTDLPTGIQSYSNAITLINNLKITKNVTQEDVVYSLVSSFDDFQDNEVDFYDYIQNAINAWGVENEDYWFNSLVTKVEELIRQYESR